MDSLCRQIEHQLLLVRGARERGDIVEEDRASDWLDVLLARVPHASRF